MSIYVMKDKIEYECPVVGDKVKCGKCKRGNMTNVHGALQSGCLVCHALFSKYTSNNFSPSETTMDVSAIVVRNVEPLSRFEL